MAQSYQTDSGNLVIPGAYPSYSVVAGSAGLSTTGVLALIGEADAGPSFRAEADINENFFGADQTADVIAKYGSGPLVDAFLQASVASSDPEITGAPSSLILVKTNTGARASSNLLKLDGSTVYAALAAKSIGKPGNLIAYTVSDATSEQVPTTGAFSFIQPTANTDVGFRVNGQASVAPATLTTSTTPASFVSAVGALSGLSATGGANLASIDATMAGNSASYQLTMTTVGNVATFTLSGVGGAVWGDHTGATPVIPAVGSTIVVPGASSILYSASTTNGGSYVVTAATSTVITATKVANLTPGSVVAPVGMVATNMQYTTDFNAYGPVTISVAAGATIDGVGKSLEINELTSSAGLISQCIYVGTSPATFVSKSSAPTVITSAVERSVKLEVSRQFDNVLEDMTAGGTVYLLVSYKGTSATLTITSTQLSTSVTGGAGANIAAINLADYPTIADIATYINAQPGYSAQPASAALGQNSPTVLDEGTFNIGSTFGAAVGRIKGDAISFFNAVSKNSTITQLGTGATPTPPASGLPHTVVSVAYLAGGARGGTANQDITDALSALENARLNFVVPLFSRDASADITDGLTDSTSTYTIASVHALAKTHVLKMSTLKKRRQRQAFLSIRDTFANAQQAAATLATHRASMAFQDVKVLNSKGNIVQAQPFINAATVAGMQAAGFYRAIFNKSVNISGFVQAAGDYNYLSDTQVETALQAGLIPLTKPSSGGFKYVSDQTTYSKDNNFVYNSIQAVYIADTIALTTAQRMEDRFVGESLADVSASAALTFLEGIMDDLLRLKLIAPSDDAPAGFKNVVIKISGPVMVVSFEVKLAGALYFIPINFQISQVTQTASA